MDSHTEKNSYRNHRMTGNQYYYMKGENSTRNDRRYKWAVNKNSRSRKHPFRSRNDHVSRRNFKHIQRRSIGNDSSRGSNQSVEDAEEEERRKQLSTTANKLLSKIQTWRAEGQTNETPNQPTDNASTSNLESSKPKRIAHSITKTKSVQKPAPKTSTKPKKNSKHAKYDVNRTTVKDFQNRIRHKLINEIMQMPKENLQNVLNDPKINPLMEVKMSSLVRENKLLICQKLRMLAESKMMTNGSSELLVDIDKLIEPVIETDLSVLPYELIKKMENIFQVQFDYTNCGTANEESVQTVDPKPLIEVASAECSKDIPLENSEDFNPSDSLGVRTDNRSLSDDLRVYECSTDEDEELDNENETKCLFIDSSLDLCETSEPLETKFRTPIKCDVHTKLFLSETEQETETPVITLKNFTESNLCSTHEQSTQTRVISESKATQTHSESQVLYGIPLPRQSGNSPAELLEEVNSIQNLINKLNERRFMIFLELAKTDPGGNIVWGEPTRKNFIESVTNGDMCLVESLKKFFYRGGK